METLAELVARDEEVEREWRWLHETLNEIARVRADHGEAQAFRLMQQQAMRVGQRRVELRLKMAEFERYAYARAIASRGSHAQDSQPANHRSARRTLQP